MTKQQYPAQRLAGLSAYREKRRKETVQRLRGAIESLESKGFSVSADNILCECGMPYIVYARNPEAIALFHARSTVLAAAGRLPAYYDPLVLERTAGRPVLERLQEAIAALEMAGQPVTVINLRLKHGLRYNTLKREPEALALFHEHSAGIKARQSSRQARESPSAAQKRDPFL